MAFVAFDMRDKADTAGIVFIARIIQAGFLADFKRTQGRSVAHSNSSSVRCRAKGLQDPARQ
jgi:hypothetical protein